MRRKRAPKYLRLGAPPGVARPRVRRLETEAVRFALRAPLRFYRDEGRALTGFEAGRVSGIAAPLTTSEALEIAERFGFRFSGCAPKRLIVAALYDALLIEPEFDATGRLVAPRFVYRPAKKRFVRKDKEEKTR